MWTWRSAISAQPVEGHSGPAGSASLGVSNSSRPNHPLVRSWIRVGVGSAIFAIGRLVQLLPSGSPIEVEPPQVQSPEQPGTSANPLLQAVPLLLNSVKPFNKPVDPLHRRLWAERSFPTRTEREGGRLC